MENKKIKISGIVNYIGKIEDKTYVTIKISDKQKEFIKSLIEDYDSYQSTPIRKDAKSGSLCFKSGTNFEVAVYEDSVESDLTLTEIGVNSKVIIHVSIKETMYKRQQYISAYLKSINIIKLEPYIKYNPFLDDEAEEI